MQPGVATEGGKGSRENKGGSLPLFVLQGHMHLMTGSYELAIAEYFHVLQSLRRQQRGRYGLEGDADSAPL